MGKEYKTETYLNGGGEKYEKHFTPQARKQTAAVEKISKTSDLNNTYTGCKSDIIGVNSSESKVCNLDLSSTADQDVLRL